MLTTENEKIIEEIYNDSEGFLSKNFIKELIYLCDKLKNEKKGSLQEIASKILNLIYFNVFPILFQLPINDVFATYGATFKIGIDYMISRMANSEYKKHDKIVFLDGMESGIKFICDQIREHITIHINELNNKGY